MGHMVPAWIACIPCCVDGDSRGNHFPCAPLLTGSGAPLFIPWLGLLTPLDFWRQFLGGVGLLGGTLVGRQDIVRLSAAGLFFLTLAV